MTQTTAAATAARAERLGLHRVGTRSPFFRYLREVWERHEFAITFAQTRIQANNQRQRLGMFWVVLRPLLDACVYGLVFGVILGSSRPPNFIPFLVTGVFMASLFGSALSQGCRSLTSHGALVRSLHFPRMVLPLSDQLKDLLNFVPVTGVLVVILVAFGNLPRLEWLLFVPVVALYAMFNTGVMLVCARLNAFTRDTANITPFVNRIFFYTSGIFYDLHQVLSHHPPILWQIAQWSPLNAFVTLARGALLPGGVVDPKEWLIGCVWAAVMLAFGLVFFWQAEERYGQYV